MELRRVVKEGPDVGALLSANCCGGDMKDGSACATHVDLRLLVVQFIHERRHRLLINEVPQRPLLDEAILRVLIVGILAPRTPPLVPTTTMAVVSVEPKQRGRVGTLIPTKEVGMVNLERNYGRCERGERLGKAREQGEPVGVRRLNPEGARRVAGQRREKRGRRPGSWLTSIVSMRVPVSLFMRSAMSRRI